jgi:hypothetical protein
VPLTFGGHVAATTTPSAQVYQTPQARQQAGGNTAGVAQTSTAAPTFNPIVEFFRVMAKSYQGVRVDKLKSLQDFQYKAGESLREAYSWMRRLIVATSVTEAQSVQFWYAMLTSELRNKARSAMLLKSEAPTLKMVFELAELVKLNIVEEQVRAIAPLTKSTTTSQAQKAVSRGRPSK